MSFDYKYEWQMKYEELQEEGLSDIEAQEGADDYCSSYMYEKADYDRQAKKEERLINGDK